MDADAPEKQLSRGKVHQLLGAEHLTTEPGRVLVRGRVKIDKKKLEVLAGLRDSLGEVKRSSVIRLSYCTADQWLINDYLRVQILADFGNSAFSGYSF